MDRKKAPIYIDLYSMYEDYFHYEFGEESEELWMIYTAYMVDEESLIEIANKLYISESSVVRKINKVEIFFEGIDEYIFTHQPLVNEFKGDVKYPNAFTLPKVHSRRKVLNVYMLSVFLLQRSIYSTVNLTDLNQIDKDSKRRATIINELSEVTISSDETGEIKVYDFIIERNGIITFSFTREATIYLDPEKGVFKAMFGV